MRNKRRPVKPIKCGMLFSRSVIQPEDLKPEISAEASHQLGSDIHDAVVFHELSTGLHIQFKTRWGPDRDVFTLCRETGIDAPDFGQDMICMLTTETNNRSLTHRLNNPFFEGKRVLEWDRVKKLVRLGVKIAVRYASFFAGDDFQFRVVGDTCWLPDSFLRKHVRVGEGEDSFVIVSLSEYEI